MCRAHWRQARRLSHLGLQSLGRGRPDRRSGRGGMRGPVQPLIITALFHKQVSGPQDRGVALLKTAHTELRGERAERSLLSSVVWTTSGPRDYQLAFQGQATGSQPQPPSVQRHSASPLDYIHNNMRILSSRCLRAETDGSNKRTPPCAVSRGSFRVSNAI